MARLALGLEVILENVVGLRFFAPILDHDARAADLRRYGKWTGAVGAVGQNGCSGQSGWGRVDAMGGGGKVAWVRWVDGKGRVGVGWKNLVNESCKTIYQQLRT